MCCVSATLLVGVWIEAVRAEQRFRVSEDRTKGKVKF